MITFVLGQPIGKIEVMCITIKFICEKALEIASGLDFLASKNVVHGDLAARIGFPTFCMPFSVEAFIGLILDLTL